MAVKIRLSRKGRRKMPIYDIVVADERAPRDGKFIEKLGQYNPNSTPAGLVLDGDRALYWLMVGAQPTDTTRKILATKGVMLKKHLQVGVNKGAITQEDADKKFLAWETEKEAARTEKLAKLADAQSTTKKAAFDAERKKKEDMQAKKVEAEQAIVAAAEAKEAEAIAAKEAAENPVVEEVAETAEVAAEETTEVVENSATEEASSEETPEA